MKKATNRILSFLSAFAMVLGILVAPFTSANAAEGDADPAPETPAATSDVTETLTIHKILMSKEALGKHNVNKEGYNGNEIEDIKKFFEKNAQEISGVYFKLQKPKKGVTNPDVNKDADWQDLGKEYEGLTKEKGLTINTSDLKGQYRIVEDLTESTYKGENGEQLAAAKAVPSIVTLPLVNNDGVIKKAHVYPKNTQEAPKIDKNFDKEANGDAAGISTADLINNEDKKKDVEIKTDDNRREKGLVTKNIGDKVPYKVVTEIPQDAKYKKLVWTDQMTEGLTYNKDLKVTLGDTELDAADYTVINTDRGFTLKLTDAGLTKVEEAAKTKAQTITLKYTATVNKNAKVDVEDENDVALDYSNKPGKDSEPKEGKPVNKEIKVTKDWAIDGKEITEADETAKALFTLQEKQKDGTWKDVDSHEVTAAEHFEYTFKDLDNDKTYRVVEQVSGYEPEYVSFENGVVTIKDNKDSKNPNTLNPSEPKVVTGGKKFVKTNQDGSERLLGAEFYVKNSKGKYLVKAAQKDNTAVTNAKKALDNAKAKYDALSPEEQESEEGQQAKAEFDAAQEAYDKAVKDNLGAGEGYAWGKKDDTNVVLLKSNEQGQFEITGLAYGNDYKLEEKTPPKDYAKLNSDVDFKVEKGSYSTKDVNIKYDTKDEANSAKQVVNKKVTIPQTGGIGSLIFIVAGIVIMAIAFAMKRRNSYEEA